MKKEESVPKLEISSEPATSHCEPSKLGFSEKRALFGGSKPAELTNIRASESPRPPDASGGKVATKAQW